MDFTDFVSRLSLESGAVSLVTSQESICDNSNRDSGISLSSLNETPIKAKKEQMVEVSDLEPCIQNTNKIADVQIEKSPIKEMEKPKSFRPKKLQRSKVVKRHLHMTEEELRFMRARERILIINKIISEIEKQNFEAFMKSRNDQLADQNLHRV